MHAIWLDTFPLLHHGYLNHEVASLHRATATVLPCYTAPCRFCCPPRIHCYHATMPLDTIPCCFGCPHLIVPLLSPSRLGATLTVLVCYHAHHLLPSAALTISPCHRRHRPHSPPRPSSSWIGIIVLSRFGLIVPAQACHHHPHHIGLS